MSDKKINNKEFTRNETILFISVAMVFLIGLLLLGYLYKNLSKDGFFGPPPGSNLRQRQIAVDNIRDWMTFKYINHSFNLPLEYLKSNLNITNKKYPDITISKWAKESKQDKNVLLEQIKKLIQDHQNVPLTLPPPPPAAIQ